MKRLIAITRHISTKVIYNIRFNRMFIRPIGYMYLLVCICALSVSTEAQETNQEQEDFSSSRYQTFPDGTVKDKTTGLLWKRCSEGQRYSTRSQECRGRATTYSYQEVKNINMQEYGAYSVWRAPSREELASLNAGLDSEESTRRSKKRNKDATINTEIFDDTPAAFYWSSTEEEYYPEYAWGVDFGLGKVYYVHKKKEYYVRLVISAEEVLTEEARAEEVRKAEIAKSGFTKLDSNGDSLIDQYQEWSEHGSEDEGTKWSCVQATGGLIWEIKTNDGGARDKDKEYRWGGKTAVGRDKSNRKGNYYDDWNTLVDAANQEKLCGYNDWRVPTIDELKTVLESSIKEGGYINTNIFPYAQTLVYSWYWSASPNTYSIFYAWGINFKYGNDNLLRKRVYRNYVRLVRRQA